VSPFTHLLGSTSIGSIFQPILKFFGGILAFFYALIPNYPIDVALLTIVIMAALTPLTVKSTKNMAAMQALGPEMKKLQQKYKGAENRAQLNEEMMKLYKEHNVNPASGCLPMLLQMPAFFVLYSVIRGITNTVAKGASLPYTYNSTTGALTTTPSKCLSSVCAYPRYISPSSKMYHQIVAAHGQLNSFGMNFADKLLSHHGSIWAAIPFLLLVLASVGLQYLQMARLNARNPQAAQANPQAAMLQKYMPLIFGLIYLNVAAILNVYFIVSSAIRIGTQEVLFRKGIVAGPGTPPTAKPSGKPKTLSSSKDAGVDDDERALPKPTAPKPGGAKPPGPKPAAKTGSGTAQNGRPAQNGKPSDAGKQNAGSANGSNGNKAPTGESAAKAGASSNGSGGAESDEGTGDAAKKHPRSKAKRARKAR
jgi:YidC/Oxa1 family membrane protein insertase